VRPTKEFGGAGREPGGTRGQCGRRVWSRRHYIKFCEARPAASSGCLHVGVPMALGERRNREVVRPPITRPATEWLRAIAASAFLAPPSNVWAGRSAGPLGMCSNRRHPLRGQCERAGPRPQGRRLKRLAQTRGGHLVIGCLLYADDTARARDGLQHDRDCEASQQTGLRAESLHCSHSPQRGNTELARVKDGVNTPVTPPPDHPPCCILLGAGESRGPSTLS
jgi:hypothetical protein